MSLTKNLAKLSKKEETSAGTPIDTVKAVRYLFKLQNYGDEIDKKCGSRAFNFIVDLQKKADKYGERLLLSEKQWSWLQEIAERVLR